MKEGHKVLFWIAVCLVALILAPQLQAQSGFAFQANRKQTVPRTQSGAVANCVGTLSADESEFTLYCSHDVPDANAAHIHLGAPGVAGPVIFPLGDGTSPISATWSPDATEVAQLLIGDLYVNIHSDEFQEGAIRGQIVRQIPVGETKSPVVTLNGAGVLPTPVDTDATGRCVGFVSADQLTAEFICVHDVENPTGLFLGPPGLPILPIAVGADVQSPIRVTADISLLTSDPSIEIQDVAGVLTSEAFPNGEIGGLVTGCASGPETLCLRDERFEVEVEFTDFEGNSGTATPVPVTSDSGLMWFFAADNLEMLVKILRGCGLNDHYWVFFAATTDVEFTLTVTDWLSGQEKEYFNPLGQAANAVTDTMAFATCP